MVLCCRYTTADFCSRIALGRCCSLWKPLLASSSMPHLLTRSWELNGRFHGQICELGSVRDDFNIGACTPGWCVLIRPQSGEQRTLTLAMTFLSCLCSPLSSPSLVIPGKVTQRISLPSRPSSSSPPISSINSPSNVLIWCASITGIVALKIAFCTRRSLESSIALWMRTRRPWKRAGADCPSVKSQTRLSILRRSASVNDSVAFSSSFENPL